MTTVGKILTLVITFLSVVFLALSTVVFSTATDWKKAADKRQADITKLNADLNKFQGEASERTKDLENAKVEHETAVAQLQNRIKELEDTNDEFQRQATAARTQLEKTSENAKTALADAQARVEETDKLRETLDNVQQLNTRYREAQVTLQDQVVQLERDLDVAKTNNKDLRERAAQLTALRSELELLRGELTRPGSGASPALKARTTRLAGLLSQKLSEEQVNVMRGAPANLEGQVIRVDDRNRYVELSIGSDDGLIPGHRLYLQSPTRGYIGELTIKTVEPDKALATVTSTYLGRKPQEGDVVKPAK